MFNEKKLLHGLLLGCAMHKPQLNNNMHWQTLVCIWGGRCKLLYPDMVITAN